MQLYKIVHSVTLFPQSLLVLLLEIDAVLLATLQFIYVHFFFYACRLPQIYEEYRHTIQNADASKDLKWWSSNHGVGMAMNWPQFEVISLACFHE